MELVWLPDLIDTDLRRIHVWTAGCTCGEEVYSFKIIWERLNVRYESLPPGPTGLKPMTALPHVFKKVIKNLK